MSAHAYPAPAKLNLFLHVTGRRADGYHLLQTVFRFIDYGDALHFTLRSDGQVLLSQSLPGVPLEQDLCFRAARLLQASMGTPQGAFLRVHAPRSAILPSPGTKALPR